MRPQDVIQRASAAYQDLRAIPEADMTDPAIMRLPHPRRYALGRFAESLMFASGLDPEAFARYAADETLTIKQLGDEGRKLPGFQLCLDALSDSPGARNTGPIETMIVYLRWKVVGKVVFTLEDDLDRMLRETDIADGMPCGLLVPPHPRVFVEFGQARDSGLTVWNALSGHHPVEGAYIDEVAIEAVRPGVNAPEDTTAVGLRVGEPARILTVVFTGSPVGHQNFGDDAFTTYTFYLQDPEEDVLSMLDRHYRYYSQPSADIEPLTEDSGREMRALMLHLAKALLYIVSSDARREQVAEHSEAIRRLDRLGPKKKAKAQRKMLRLYDRIVVRPPPPPPAVEHPVGHGSGRTVATHWRRPHLRPVRYGPGRQRIRVRFIHRTLVNGHLAGLHQPTPKSYRVTR